MYISICISIYLCLYIYIDFLHALTYIHIGFQLFTKITQNTNQTQIFTTIYKRLQHLHKFTNIYKSLQHCYIVFDML